MCVWRRVPSAPASNYITDKITDSVGNYVMGQAMVAICNALFAFTMLFLGFSFP